MNNYKENLSNLIQLLKNNIETMEENINIMKNISARIENLPEVKQFIKENPQEF